MKAQSLLPRIDHAYQVAGVGLIAIAEAINRIWVASVFWQSGLVKIQSWSSTQYLFRHEYAVPLLPPDGAAVLGTGAELVLPVFLALGLGGRLAAGALVVFNITAVVSYPGLNAAGIQAHMIWGLMLLAATLRGPGLLSLDAAISAWWRRRAGASAPGRVAEPPVPAS